MDSAVRWQKRLELCDFFDSGKYFTGIEPVQTNNTSGAQIAQLNKTVLLQSATKNQHTCGALPDPDFLCPMPNSSSTWFVYICLTFKWFTMLSWNVAGTNSAKWPTQLLRALDQGPCQIPAIAEQEQNESMSICIILYQFMIIYVSTLPNPLLLYWDCEAGFETTRVQAHT